MPKKIFGIIIAVIALCLLFVISPTPVAARGSSSSTYCECTNTYSDGSVVTEDGADVSIFGDDNGCYCGGIQNAIHVTIDIFIAGISVLGTIGIIWAGIMIMRAGDDSSQVVAARRRILNVAIGLVAFGLLGVIISFFLPGGTANSTPVVISSVSNRIERPFHDITTPIKDSDSDDSGGSGGSGCSGGRVANSVDDAVWNNGNECSGDVIFPEKKYALTEEEISYFSELVAIENCRGEDKSDVKTLGCKLLATQIINLYEEHEYERGGREGCTSGSCYYKDMKKWINSEMWYQINHRGGMTPGTYSNSNSRQAVIDVIVNGNRVMPKFVSRYDGLYHWTNNSHYSDSSYWGLNSISEAASAVPMQTQVKSGGRYLWCIERKQTGNSYNGPYNEVFNYADSYRRAVGM